jgi:hypothetical protein
MAETKLIDLEKDKFLTYKYVLSELYVIIDGESEEFPIEQVSDFKIEHYFEEATFPIFKLTCIMEASRYYKLIKNKSKVKFKLRLQSFYIQNDDPLQKASMLTDVINDTFVFFPDDDNDDYDIDQKKEAGTENDENELDQLLNGVELFLFKESYVTGLRQSFNTVLTSVNLTTAVTYLLYKAGINKVLMSPFENTKNYGTLVLPPQSIDKQIRYLNNNFGFHKNGTIVYFGLLHSYFINYKAGCTAWYKKEWKDTIIMILEKSNHLSFLSAAIQKPDEEKYYYNATTEGLTIASNTVSTNVLTGVNATVIDMAGSSTSTATAKNAKTVGDANKNIVFNNYSNQYMGDVYATQMSANATTVTLNLDNVKLEAFNPNKNFTFVFENADLNSKYKGSYRLGTALYYFTGSPAEYKVTATLTFKKVG